MTVLNDSDHHDKNVGNEHFLQLIQVANADGVIDRKEHEMLHRIGKQLGFTDPEIDELIEKRNTKIYAPPYELEERFHQLYNVVAMAMADGVLFTNEINMIRRLAIASSFSERDTERLINLLVNGLKYNKSEEELFQLFQHIK